jgi:hypothetical protein
MFDTTLYLQYSCDQFQMQNCVFAAFKTIIMKNELYFNVFVYKLVIVMLYKNSHEIVINLFIEKQFFTFKTTQITCILMPCICKMHLEKLG